MIENYMDYSAETCTNTFTKGQVAIMQAVLEGPRKGLLESPLRISEADKTVTFKITPNPATDYIYLTINDLEQSKYNKLDIFDVNGRLVLTKVLEQNTNHSIDIQALIAGLYIVKINQNVFKIRKM
jgi:hypothetical protein